MSREASSQQIYDVPVLVDDVVESAAAADGAAMPTVIAVAVATAPPAIATFLMQLRAGFR
jgi:hypothetical protein